MGTPIDVSGFGKLSIASNANAPLLVVFGGIPVLQSVIDGIRRDSRHDPMVGSAVYMWNYMNDVSDRFHVFVAIDPHVVDGVKAYEALMNTVSDKNLTPSQQILYLFSGGWKPGRALLQGKGDALFSSIFLVDIWMGNATSSDFYRQLASTKAQKITYAYTSFGANNDDTRDYIASQVGSTRAVQVPGGGMATHMKTNKVAVGMLP